MTNINVYEEAFAEVVEVLNYIPMNVYNKIPKKYIIFLEENCSEKSSFVYNIALPFEKQNISDTAKNILGMIFRLFIIEQSKKEELNHKEQDREKKEEFEKFIKYNTDELFKNKNTYENVLKCIPQENALIEYKEKFFTKFKNFLKKLLHFKK